MKIFSARTIILTTLTLLISVNLFAKGGKGGGSSASGGNTSGGGNPFTVTESSIKLLITGNGLKSAMLNYLKTLPVEKIDDMTVRNLFARLLQNDFLQIDIRESKYIASESCEDTMHGPSAASALMGKLGSDICFNPVILAKLYQGMDDENVMVQLASLAFHEHVHHFQVGDRKSMRRNEEDANRLAGYVQITAKFVQLPLLKWSNPGAGPVEFQEIQSLYEVIKAKEQRFIAPDRNDYRGYEHYYAQKDSGVFKLLPREKYDHKMSINGGGAYYSFKSKDHDYGRGSDISLEGGYLSSGFAGCDFGHLVHIERGEIEDITESHPALKYFLDFKIATTHSEVRKQQSTRELRANGYEYKQRTEFKVGDVFGLRSIYFGDPKYGSDSIVVFKILKQRPDGSIVIVWKKIKDFTPIQCPSPSE